MWIRTFFQRVKNLLFVESWIDLLVQRLSSFSIPYWIICTVAGFIVFFSSGNALVHKKMWKETGNFGGFTILFSYLSLSFLVGYGLYLAFALDNRIKPSLQNNIFFSQETKNTKAFKVETTWLKRSWFVVKNLLIISIFIFFSDHKLLLIILALVLLATVKNKEEHSSSSHPAITAQEETLKAFFKSEQRRSYLLKVIENLLLIYLLFHLLFSYAQFIAIIIFVAIGLKTSKLIISINKLRVIDIKFSILDLSPLYQLSHLTKKITFYLLPLTFSWLMFNLAITTGLILIYLIGQDVDVATSIFSLQRFQQLITLDFFSIYNEEPISGGFLLFIIINPILILLIQVFIFTQPILWMREKIIAQKNAQISEIGLKIQKTFQDQDKYVEENNFKRVAELRDYATALISRKEYIQKISEWPWEGRVFREFLTSLLIPLILLIVQILLASWFRN